MLLPATNAGSRGQSPSLRGPAWQALCSSMMWSMLNSRRATSTLTTWMSRFGMSELRWQQHPGLHCSSPEGPTWPIGGQEVPERASCRISSSAHMRPCSERPLLPETPGATVRTFLQSNSSRRQLNASSYSPLPRSPRHRRTPCGRRIRVSGAILQRRTRGRSGPWLSPPAFGPGRRGA